jgi:hypothetical protein
MYKILFLFVISISLTAQAQDEKKKKIRYLIVDFGMLSHPNSYYSEELNKVKSQSVILSSPWYDSLKGYNPFYNQAVQRTSNVQIQVGFNLARREGASYFTNPKLMLGLQFYSLGTHFAKGTMTTSPYDTLTSSQTGEKYFLDNQRIKAVSFQNEQAVAQLNVGYQTNILNQSKRFNPYVGMSLGAGAVYRNSSNISFNDSEHGTGSHFSNLKKDTVYTQIGERFDTKGNYILNAEIKVGVDYQFKKLPAYKVFAEYKFGLLALNSGSKFQTNFKHSFQLGIQLDLWSIKKSVS